MAHRVQGHGLEAKVDYVRALTWGATMKRCKLPLMWQTQLPLLLVSSLDLKAQQVSSFEQLQLLVKPGDTITVVQNVGKITKGKLIELSSSLLRVNAGDAEKAFSPADVMEITERRSDPLSNGAKWGALVHFRQSGTGARSFNVSPSIAAQRSLPHDDRLKSVRFPL